MPPNRANLHRRRSLSLRRLLGAFVAVAMLWGLFWLAFQSGLAAPLVELAGPAIAQVIAMINDPLGIDWGGQLLALSAIAIPHMLVLLFIFE
ncbi:hypothetical protein [Nocardiopsis eucommiae]|uniref:hypothetical protein n=1 Tax=Nocardiopsis eucommiae TaxID=2831970 RepID=UPI003D75FB9C